MLYGISISYPGLESLLSDWDAVIGNIMLTNCRKICILVLRLTVKKSVATCESVKMYIIMLLVHVTICMSHS